MTIVEEARSWIGTPYVSGAHLKRVGVDCVGLIIGVGKNCGFVDPDYHPGPYQDHDSELLQRELARWMEPVKEAQPGDVLVLSLPMGRNHCAILVPDRRVVHVYGYKFGVTEHPLDDRWKGRVTGIWRWAIGESA